MGFNQYFSSRKQNVDQQPHIKEWGVLNLSLDALLDVGKNNIPTLRELQRYIDDSISERDKSPNPVLVQLRPGERNHTRATFVASLPPTIEKIDLLPIYLEYRTKHPHKSKFPCGKLKLLVHIRMGDVALIKTPWGTWLCPLIYRADGGEMKRGWQEYLHEDEFGLLTIADFHNFTQHLVSYFSDDTFAICFFSDGLRRLFSDFNNALKSGASSFPKITKKQLSILIKLHRRYGQEFKVLENVKNSVSVIGETKLKTFDFI